MPSLEQKAVMVSPVSFCLLTSSRIFDSLIIFKLFWLKINQPQQLVKDVLRRMLTIQLQVNRLNPHFLSQQYKSVVLLTR